MRATRRPLSYLLAALLLPTLALSTGAKGEGMSAGCFRKPLLAHDRGLLSLSDVVVFATAAPDTIQVYSVSQARVTNTIKAADRLQDCFIAPRDPSGADRPRAYVVTKSGHLAAYDLGRNSILDDIKMTDDPDATGGSVAVSADGRYVAAGIGDSQFQIKEIEVRNADKLGELLQTISIGGDLQDLVANPVLPELYIFNDRASKVRIFNFDSLTLDERVLDLTGSSSQFVVSPDGVMALASINARNKVVFIDLRTKRLFYEVILPDANPHAITFNPEGTIAYVADRRARGLLYRIDLMPIRTALASGEFGSIRQETIASGKAMPRILAESAFIPDEMAVSSDGNFLYVIAANSTHFAVVNLTSIESLRTANPDQFGYLRDLVAPQVALTDAESNSGMYEIQGVNLAKSPTTFDVLHNSNLIFSFTGNVGRKTKAGETPTEGLAPGEGSGGY